MKRYIKYRNACRRLKNQDRERDQQIREINAKTVDPDWDAGLDPVEVSIIDEFAALRDLKIRPYLEFLDRH